MEAEIHFTYPIQHDPKLKELKDISDLKIELNKSELEKANDIIGYAHGMFTHDGDNTPSANDPLTILKEAQAGHPFRCVEYSTLAAGLLWANDIPARTIGLKTSDVETREYGAGHVVIEFWDNTLQKWIMSDVQAGIIPFDGNTPLSAYELSQKLLHVEAVQYLPVTGSKFSSDNSYGEKVNNTYWIKEYLYFIDTPVVLTLGNEDKSQQQIAMLVPPGVKPPEMFQGLFKMNAIYTQSITDFYIKPV